MSINNIAFEIWHTVNINKNYMVSNKGRVLSLPRIETINDANRGVYSRKRSGRKIKLVDTSVGYLQVSINGRSVHVHRLVAKAFIPNPLSKPQVNHKDLNKKNNITSNLEWVSAQENSQHANDNGACPPPAYPGRGVDSIAAKLNKQQVQDIKRRLEKGETQSSIASIYSVAASTISWIKRGFSYADVNCHE